MRDTGKRDGQQRQTGKRGEENDSRDGQLGEERQTGETGSYGRSDRQLGEEIRTGLIKQDRSDMRGEKQQLFCDQFSQFLE